MPYKPTAGDVHVNRPLSNISIAYLQDEANFVAGRVFPTIPVTNKSDSYWTYDRGYFNRDDMKERAPNTESAGGNYAVDADANFSCRVMAFHHDIPDQVRANEDAPLSSDRDATILVTRKALINREKNWATKYFGASIWTGINTGVAATPTGTQVLFWSDAASNPIEDVRSAKTSVLELTGFEPNTLVLGQRVLDKLLDHPDVIDRVKYGQTPGGPAVIELNDLAALFKVPRILVMKSIETTSAEGQTNVSAFIGGKKALLVYSAPSPGIMTPSGGYTFAWTGMLGMNAAGMRIKRFRIEPLSSDRVEVESAYDSKLVSADLGHFFNTIVA